MHRLALAATSGLAFAALGACASSGPRLLVTPAAFASPDERLPACPVAASGNVGIVWLVIPPGAPGRGSQFIRRGVWYKPGEFVEGRDSNDVHQSGAHRAHRADAPFDIILSDIPFTRSADPAANFVLVHLLLRTSYRSTFYDRDGMHGVGVPDGNRDAVCGERPIATDGRYRIASFFIDLAKFPPGRRSDAYFSILSAQDGHPGEPIRIDPKIYNEG